MAFIKHRDQSNEARLRQAQESLERMPETRRKLLDELIKERLIGQIECRSLPPAAGYNVVFFVDQYGEVHLGAELTDSDKGVIAGPISIGALSDAGVEVERQHGRAREVNVVSL
jgi:hypothetical protein